MILWFSLLQYKCFIETCALLFWNLTERNNHCIEIHKIPMTFLQQFKNKYKLKIICSITIKTRLLFFVF